MKVALFTLFLLFSLNVVASPCEKEQGYDCADWVHKNKTFSSLRKYDLYQKICDNGYLPGCTMAGYEADILNKKSEALSLYEKACNDKSKHSCYFLGSLLYKQQKFQRAKDALMDICISNDNDACWIIGKIESKIQKL